MRQAGLAGVSRRRFVTTVRDGARQAPDLVERDFTAERPNMLWVADITYIPTWAGFLYLAVALDAFSRRIVGWAMATTLHTQLVLDALNMALATRRPKGVIHHSDQGSQYTSIAFGKRCREAGVRPSMGSVGDAYDNAMAESFFATLECELLDRRRFKTQAEARMAVFEFIEGFYNPRRRHSSLGYLSPIDYERRHERASGRSRRTPACRRARGRQGCGLEMSQQVSTPARRPTLTAPARAGAQTCGPGRRNGLRRGRTKEQDQTGGHDAVTSDTLNPNPHPSTKPGQVHGCRRPGVGMPHTCSPERSKRQRGPFGGRWCGAMWDTLNPPARTHGHRASNADIFKYHAGAGLL